MPGFVSQGRPILGGCQFSLELLRVGFFCIGWHHFIKAPFFHIAPSSNLLLLSKWNEAAACLTERCSAELRGTWQHSTGSSRLLTPVPVAGQLEKSQPQHQTFLGEPDRFRWQYNCAEGGRYLVMLIFEKLFRCAGPGAVLLALGSACWGKRRTCLFQRSLTVLEFREPLWKDPL